MKKFAFLILALLAIQSSGYAAFWNDDKNDKNNANTSSAQGAPANTVGTAAQSSAPVDNTSASPAY